MLIRPYEMPWRRAYEVYAGVAWSVALVSLIIFSVRENLPSRFIVPLVAISLGMAVLRLHQALRILVVRASLSGRAMQVITTKELNTLCQHPEEVFLGFGFDWLPVHSQRLYELAKVNFRDFAVSPAILRSMGYEVNPQPDSEIGLPYIHGVEPRERALYRPLQNFEGGTLLVGTTQAGKGVALANLITQAIQRGDVVIVIDPKNSRRLKRAVVRACQDFRESDTFLEFHPAFPENGVRLDFTFNWQKPTEVASRIQSIMPPDTAGAFSAFGWDAVNVVVQGLVDLEERPNLMKLTKYIEGGIEPVLEVSLRRFFNTVLGATWRELPDMKKLLNDAQRGNLKRPSEAASNELLAFVAFYEHHVAQTQRNKVIDSQVRTFRHNREHYQKITANLLPILSMLTSGDLGIEFVSRPIRCRRRAGDHEFREDRTRRLRSVYVSRFLARPIGGLGDRRVISGRFGRARRHALQPRRLPAHFAFCGRSIERNQPTIDRNTQQGRGGRYLYHLRDANAGRSRQTPG